MIVEDSEINNEVKKEIKQRSSVNPKKKEKFIYLNKIRIDFSKSKKNMQFNLH